MKRVNNIYDRICSLDNLRLADENARKGKRNTYGVRFHDKNRELNILNLKRALENRTFSTSPYDVFTIYEPKEREIYRLPYYPDRIVHHAVMNVLGPVWRSIFTADTYSCIKGRGIHSCVKKLKRHLRNDPAGTKYCLKIDIKKFYPSIDHQIMKDILSKKIKDKDVMWLLGDVIDSAPGLPIGNYLSQYFANLYLAYFDHWVKEGKKVKYYYRYADDMVFLSNSKEHLHDLFVEVKQYLNYNLKLEVKDNHQVFPVKSRGIDFIGYRFYHTHTLLRKSIKKSFARAMKKGKESSLSAYMGWAAHCDSINLINKLTNGSKQNASGATCH